MREQTLSGTLFGEEPYYKITIVDQTLSARNQYDPCQAERVVIKPPVASIIDQLTGNTPVIET